MTTEFSGAGSIGAVRELLEEHGSPPTLIVTGGASFELCGAKRALDPILEGTQWTQFADFSPNPKCSEIDRAVAVAQANRCELVVGVGGGSALDVAKVAAICLRNPGKCSRYARNELTFTADSVPVIAIPTTAGSGAEATHFAVVYEHGTKYSVAHASMLPAHRILDHELTMSLPAAITASTGMDALAQSMESWWSVGSTPESIAHSRSALVSISGALPKVVANPTPATREAMLRAASRAGQAINIAKTTAPHALSYGITSRFGVPHGHAVALTLGAFLEYNGNGSHAQVVDPRGAAHIREHVSAICSTLGVSDPSVGRRTLEGLTANLGLANRLSSLGVGRADLEPLVRAVNPQRLSNNPYAVDASQLGAILESVF